MDAERPSIFFMNDVNFAAVLKFFGQLCTANIGHASRFPKFMESLFDLIFHFDSLNASLRILAFDTLGAVGSAGCAKVFLDGQYGSY